METKGVERGRQPSELDYCRRLVDLFNISGWGETLLFLRSVKESLSKF